MRRFLLPVALFVLAGMIGLAAIVDHEWKQRRINRAEVSQWYCRHLGTRCGGPSSDAMERHWNERQIGYEAAVIVLGGTAILLGAIRAHRRWRRSAQRRLGPFRGRVAALPRARAAGARAAG